MWQRLFYGKRFSQTTLDFGPDWVKLADAYGIKGYRAANAKEFAQVFDEAFKSGKAAVINARGRFFRYLRKFFIKFAF